MEKKLPDITVPYNFKLQRFRFRFNYRFSPISNQFHHFRRNLLHHNHHHRFRTYNLRLRKEYLPPRHHNKQRALVP